MFYLFHDCAILFIVSVGVYCLVRLGKVQFGSLTICLLGDYLFDIFVKLICGV